MLLFISGAVLWSIFLTRAAYLLTITIAETMPRIAFAGDAAREGMLPLHAGRALRNLTDRYMSIPMCC